jgi:thymidine phosphorylase
MNNFSLKATLHLRRLGIDTYKESIIYMREDCHVCLSESLQAHARVRVSLGDRSIIATLNIIKSNLLSDGKAGLSEHAWKLLAAKEGDEISVSHANPVESLSYVRSKIYGNILSADEISEIIKDITAGRYSDIDISSFLTACAGGRLNKQEVIDLTKAMVESGDRLDWEKKLVVDKHCVGGLPGNRTTPIIVSIVSAYGLTMPKTSSRAITSPAGTADTMEVFTNVDLDIAAMRKVVERENGCLVWGGSVSVSPADDILIRVEKALDLDSEGQMVASVLSKKIAAGATHVLIDIPVGITSKVRNTEVAKWLSDSLVEVGETLGITVKVLLTDGSQPVGRGIGPALEARDIASVLKCEQDAPQDLRERALLLAGEILEFSSEVVSGTGAKIATQILDSGKAWKKFQAICEAQGGIKEMPKSQYTNSIIANKTGLIKEIDNRHIAKVAKLTGAPEYKVGGVDLHVRLGDKVNKGDKLFTIHADSQGMLNYVLDYLKTFNHIIKIEEN